MLRLSASILLGTTAAHDSASSFFADGGCVNVEQDINYEGHDYNNTRASSADECCSMCNADPQCQFYTLQAGICYMKSSNAGRRAAKGDVSGASLPPVPYPPYPPAPPSPPDSRPCDILDAAGNTCVAAHSTVRALYSKYDGPLYTVLHKNGTSMNISTMGPGGFANVKEHEAICPTTGVCVISFVLDQSPNGNHLGKRHGLVDASKHKIIVGDNVPVYGMYFDIEQGYHVDKTRNVPTGNDPESIYAVMTGKRFNGGCCFDYGNSETNDKDDGCGTMEAIYFGNAHWAGNSGSGEGPWVGADLEQGMYYGGGNVTKSNPLNTPLTTDFVSLGLKGQADGFKLMGGDATTGNFKTMYDGPRPDRHKAGTCGINPAATYQPMRKQGAIILATGGDFSNFAKGNFYEGFMAAGYASDETDAAVQANIVAVGYKTHASEEVVV